LPRRLARHAAAAGRLAEDAAVHAIPPVVDGLPRAGLRLAGAAARQRRRCLARARRRRPARRETGGQARQRVGAVRSLPRLRQRVAARRHAADRAGVRLALRLAPRAPRAGAAGAGHRAHAGRLGLLEPAAQPVPLDGADAGAGRGRELRSVPARGGTTYRGSAGGDVRERAVVGAHCVAFLRALVAFLAAGAARLRPDLAAGHRVYRVAGTGEPDRLRGDAMSSVSLLPRGCRPAVGVSAPCRGPSHFLLRAQEKVTKEKGTPARRSPSILPCESVSLGRAFRRGSCPGEKCAASLPHTLRAFSSESHRRTGAPAEQRASCAHSSEKPQLKLKQKHEHEHCTLSLLRRAAATRVRAGSAPLYPGPLGRGGWMEDQPAGWPTGGRPVFRQHRTCCRNTPESTRAPAGQSLSRTRSGNARRARPRGSVSLGYFSLGTQREVTLPPAGGRNACPGFISRRVLPKNNLARPSAPTKELRA